MKRNWLPLLFCIATPAWAGSKAFIDSKIIVILFDGLALDRDLQAGER